MPYFVWEAAGRSLVIALSATLLCLLLAAPLCTRGGEMIGTLGIAISPLVLGTGLFLKLRPYINPFDVALLVTIFVNAVMSLPFVLRISRAQFKLIPCRLQETKLFAWFCLVDFLRWVLLPRLKRPLAFAAGLSAALSMGDLGVIALFPERRKRHTTAQALSTRRLLEWNMPLRLHFCCCFCHWAICYVQPLGARPQCLTSKIWFYGTKILRCRPI